MPARLIAVAANTAGMVTVSEYAADVIGEILNSHVKIQSLQDKPGDLDTIRREWYRSAGLARALADRIAASKSHPREFETAMRRCNALTEYDFGPEIRLLYGLYENDPGRLRNIRLKILDAFESSKVIKEIRFLLGEIE